MQEKRTRGRWLSHLPRFRFRNSPRYDAGRSRQVVIRRGSMVCRFLAVSTIVLTTATLAIAQATPKPATKPATTRPADAKKARAQWQLNQQVQVKWNNT